MGRKRRRFSAQFKAKVAMEALKKRSTLAELAIKYDLQPTQISAWKKEIKDKATTIFNDPKRNDTKQKEKEEAKLYEKIGRLEMELDWLKKKWSSPTEEKRLLVEPKHDSLSISRQCELLDLARSSYYYQPACESDENLMLMRLMDEQWMKQPSWGSPRLTSWLQNQTDLKLNRKRVSRLMKLMGIAGLNPRTKKRTSTSAQGQDVYPYLLNKVKVEHSNQVWCSDITYIPMKRGFMYLVAVMDWFSRYVIS